MSHKYDEFYRMLSDQLVVSNRTIREAERLGLSTTLTKLKDAHYTVFRISGDVLTKIEASHISDVQEAQQEVVAPGVTPLQQFRHLPLSRHFETFKPGVSEAVQRAAVDRANAAVTLLNFYNTHLGTPFSGPGAVATISTIDTLPSTAETPAACAPPAGPVLSPSAIETYTRCPAAPDPQPEAPPTQGE